MADSSPLQSNRRYNLRDKRKKPQGVLLKRWEVEYSNLISSESRGIPLETVKTAIRSAFEEGMFEHWRITLKCPLSGQRIRTPARYADCSHIECFDLEDFLRMKTLKNLLVCPICQKEVEKPLSNLRIDEYIATVLSTLPDAMQVEFLPDGSFKEIHEEFVVEPNVINDEEPFVQDNNTPSFEIKQEALEDDTEYITLSDDEDDSLEEIVEMKPISLMPLNMDIKLRIVSFLQPDQTHSGEDREIQNMDIEPEIASPSEPQQTHSGEDREIQNMDIEPEIASPSEPQQTHSGDDREIQDQRNSATQKASPPRQRRLHLDNAYECSNPKKRRVPSKDKQSAVPSAEVNTHTDLSSSETNESGYSSGGENDEIRTLSNENDRNPTTSTQNVMDAPSDPAQKMKITAIGVDICYGTACYITSEGQKYDYGPLSDYVSILRESEADVHGCQAHIVFRTPNGGTWGKAELRHLSALASRKKFKQFSEDVHSISHLWENGRISVELFRYSADARTFLSLHDFCAGLFGQDRSILKCKVLEISWLHNLWPFSIITDAAYHCKQLIFKQGPGHTTQKMHETFLDILYTMKLPQHVDITFELNNDTYYFTSQLEKLFQRSNAQYFKFKLLLSEFPRNKLLRNDHGTLVMKKVASYCDDNGVRVNTVIIEQRPNMPVLDQQST